MKWKLAAVVVLALSIPTGAFPGDVHPQQTQLPPPFGPSKPIIPGQQCAPESQKILKLQLEAFKALQRLSRRDGEKLCASLESADQLGVQKFLDPKANSRSSESCWARSGSTYPKSTLQRLCGSSVSISHRSICAS